nr:DUF2142 domain-containing protein [Anaerolineae bacterium]
MPNIPANQQSTALTRFPARQVWQAWGKLAPLAFAVLGTLYSIITPILEVSDEYLHYPVVHHIATTGKLPVQQPDIITDWQQEGSQPPLYYLLSAAATFWVDSTDYSAVYRLNPFRKLGLSHVPDNKNVLIHTEAEQFPWQNTVLAIHVNRLLSVALVTASIALAYQAAQIIVPDKPAVSALSAWMMATNPMLIFIGSSVNNDNLMILLGTWTLLLIIRIVGEGLTTRRSLTLALVLASASLTKLSGLTLVPLAALALAYDLIRRCEHKQSLYAAVFIIATGLGIAGWWYARNIMLYGEVSGLSTMLDIAGRREPGFYWLMAVGEWRGFWMSYWAWFGTLNITVDRPIYLFYAGISLISLAGVIVMIARYARTREMNRLVLYSFALLQVLITFAGVFRWTLQTHGSQGRLLFPAAAAVSLLMAGGIVELIPDTLRAAVLSLLTAINLVLAASIPFAYIQPAYALPHTVNQVPPEAISIQSAFNGLEIVAVTWDNNPPVEGGYAPVTLYLRASDTGSQQDNMHLSLSLMGESMEYLGGLYTYPGGGAYPVDLMPTNVIVEDYYRIYFASHPAPDNEIGLLISVQEWDPPVMTPVQGIFDNAVLTSGLLISDDGTVTPVSVDYVP